MKNKKTKKRWTVVNIPDELRDNIIVYAKENGHTIAGALHQLTKKELRKWKRQKKDEQ